MDEKDKQLYETTLVVESAKQTAELGKEVVSDVIRPTSKSIGKNIGLLVDGVFGWLGTWGQKQKIKQEKNLEEFKEEINKNIEAIPQENLKDPIMYIVGPAIEASKYYYEEEQFKEMFAKLITASCDNRKTDKISPYFVDIIKQLTPNDAAVLSVFKDSSILAIVNYYLKYKNNKGNYTYNPYVFTHDAISNDIDLNSISIANLIRVGLLTVDFNRNIIDTSCYDKYYNIPVYLQLKEKIKANPNSKYQTIKIKKGVVELTQLGKNFINLCL